MLLNLLIIFKIIFSLNKLYFLKNIITNYSSKILASNKNTFKNNYSKQKSGDYKFIFMISKYKLQKDQSK